MGARFLLAGRRLSSAGRFIGGAANAQGAVRADGAAQAGRAQWSYAVIETNETLLTDAASRKAHDESPEIVTLVCPDAQSARMLRMFHGAMLMAIRLDRYATIRAYITRAGDPVVKVDNLDPNRVAAR